MESFVSLNLINNTRKKTERKKTFARFFRVFSSSRRLLNPVYSLLVTDFVR